MKKQVLFTILAMLVSVSAFSHDIEVANADGVTIYYNYSSDGTELAVTYRGSKYNDYSNEYQGNVVIPEEVTYMNRTRKVTSIGSGAFANCDGLTSVTIPNSVTSIGYQAFYKSDRISKLYILASQPPFVGSKDCFTDDVYRYAYIHIPKGTYEAYSSAYGWRYFERFKEDLAMNGTIYYAILRVNEQNNSYVEHEVKVEESYTLKFGTKRQSSIKRLLFNGDDVTEQIKDNTYTTPIIKYNSEITIEYDEQEIDVNGDGIVDTQDVLEIYKYMQEH